ncbi:hypothetical protein [Paraburkholderia sp. C35]|uniref:hypothetical protein n=1 Tax=Paraburkholderia sp. C35 TaxID=2126993 RepID=UPI000D696B75|nr:hypothetical protein [Paraburkholderia sp. C35]
MTANTNPQPQFSNEMKPGSVRHRSEQQRRALVEQFVAVCNVRKVAGVLTSRRGVKHALNRFCYHEGAAWFQDFTAATGTSFTPGIEDVYHDLRAIFGALPSTSYHGAVNNDMGRCVPLQLDTFPATEDPSSIDVLPDLNLRLDTDHHDLAGLDDPAFIDLLVERMVNAGCAADTSGRVLRFDGERWATTTEASFRTVLEHGWLTLRHEALRPRRYAEVARKITEFLLTKAHRIRFENADVVVYDVEGKRGIAIYPGLNVGVGALRQCPIDWAEVDSINHWYRPVVQQGAQHQVLEAIGLAQVGFGPVLKQVRDEAHARFVEFEKRELQRVADETEASPEPVCARRRARL